MNLVNAPIDAQEQDDQSSAHDADDILREPKQRRQHKLPLIAGQRTEEHTRRRQPLIEYLLKRCADQPAWLLPLILNRYLAGQPLYFSGRFGDAQGKPNQEPAQSQQEE